MSYSSNRLRKRCPQARRALGCGSFCFASIIVIAQCLPIRLAVQLKEYGAKPDSPDRLVINTKGKSPQTGRRSAYRRCLQQASMGDSSAPICRKNVLWSTETRLHGPEHSARARIRWRVIKLPRKAAHASLIPISHNPLTLRDMALPGLPV